MKIYLISKQTKTMKKLFLITLLLLLISIITQAQTVSSLKWADICSGKMGASWYGSEEAQQIADKLLSAQKNSGGWMKNIEFHKESDTGGKTEHSCLDNGATTQEMRFLAKVYQKTKVEKYKESFTRALNMVFTAEKGCGGWSQYWPLSGNGSYQDYITFNDDLMTNVMRLLNEIAANKGDFADMTDESTRNHCEQSFQHAIDVIIKCQVDDNGTPAAWCAQHDTITFLPTEGRPHELPSISAYESANLLSYLMTIDKPSEQLQQTIHSAVAWLDGHKTDGKAIEDFTNANGEKDRRIIDKTGSAVWGRFIQLGGATGEKTYNAFFTKLKDRNKKRSYYQNGKTYTYTEYEIATKSYDASKAYQPIFAIYDDQLQHLYYRFLYTYEDAPEATDWQGCSVPTSLNALRRVNYQFMGSWPLNVINNEYPAWKERIESQSGGDDFTTYTLSNETNTGSNTSALYNFNDNISIANSNGKGYGTGKSNTIKYSANVNYTIQLPEGMRVSKVQFYGYDNYDADAYIKSFNGQNFSATDYVFPAKDDAGNMTYVSHTLEAATPITGSFIFTLGSKQCCLIITLYHNNGSTSITLPLETKKATNNVYTIQGIRVDNPGKGIYICNGKKIIIK